MRCVKGRREKETRGDESLKEDMIKIGSNLGVLRMDVMFLISGIDIKGNEEMMYIRTNNFDLVNDGVDLNSLATPSSPVQSNKLNNIN